MWPTFMSVKTSESDVEFDLSKLRVLVTRPQSQSESLVAALLEANAIPISYPTIRLEAPPSWRDFDAAVHAVVTRTPPPYDWIVFTSPSAVRFSLAHAPALQSALSVRALSEAPHVAAVGEQTARVLRDHGVAVALVPEDQRQEGLIAALGSAPCGLRILFPQALGGRELLRDVLQNLGAAVDVVAVSQTTAVSLPDPPPDFDIAIFASPSAFRSFMQGRSASDLLDRAVAAIGPTTASAIRAAGVTVDVVPQTPSVLDLIRAIASWQRGRSPAPKTTMSS